MADECRYPGFGSTFMAFVMGAAIGGGLALLFAPRSGEETRKRVRDMADDVRERVREIREEAESRIRETIEEGRESLKEKREMVVSAVEAGKEAFEAERSKHKKPS